MATHIDGFIVSADKSKLNFNVIHKYLSNSYWAKNIPIAIVKKSIEGSLCFGVYNDKEEQIGFARVITDCTTFAYLADVFILDEYQGKGLSKLMMSFIINHPDLQGLRKWLLATKDAHGLYTQFGFTSLPDPSKYMEITVKNIYIASNNSLTDERVQPKI
jgi:GNAT superfamily N-acetyltransferase